MLQYWSLQWDPAKLELSMRANIAHLDDCISCSALKRLSHMTAEHCHYIPEHTWYVICQLLLVSWIWGQL